MDALDLRSAPPRPARSALDGIIFLPRTIDKVRATLPGGALNGYTIEGLSAAMLEQFGIGLIDFTAAVRAASVENEVAAFVRERVAAGRIDAWNAFILARRPRGGDRAAALVFYPWLPEGGEQQPTLDVLDEDDRRHYAAAV